jgi:hypothetical protein
MRRDRAKRLAFAQHQGAMGHPAELVRLRQDRIEDGLKVAGRGIDDLQHIGGRSLLLQGLVSLGFALGKFGLTLGKLTLQIGYQLLGIG